MKKSISKMAYGMMVAALAGCGGGGGIEQAEPKQVDFPAEGEATVVSDPAELLTDTITNDVLQSLSLQSDRVTSRNLAKSDVTAIWYDALQLNYVMLGAHGDILGQALATLPDRAEFTANGTAQMAVTTMSDSYVLRQGDVRAVLDLSNPQLDVDLQWSGDDITHTSETPSAQGPQNFDANITATSQGLDECGADNLICGGQLMVVIDGVSALGRIDLDSDNALFGLYGANADSAEIGGRIVLIRENELSIIGGFVAGQK